MLMDSCISFASYIKPQLLKVFHPLPWCCISFASYIKPQLVSLLLLMVLRCISFASYIKPQQIPLLILRLLSCISFASYIKPQRLLITRLITIRCISFASYIKPQRSTVWVFPLFVVYLLHPTSNHNRLLRFLLFFMLYIFCILHQTTTYRFESADFQCITITFSNKKWRAGYNF